MFFIMDERSFRLAIERERKECSAPLQQLGVFVSCGVQCGGVTSGRYSVLQQATKTGDNKARQDESSSFLVKQVVHLLLCSRYNIFGNHEFQAKPTHHRGARHAIIQLRLGQW